MCNADLPHVAIRINADGSPRYYFRRRGMPLSRLPDPSTELFQPAYAAKLSESNGGIGGKDRALEGHRRHWGRRLWIGARYRPNRNCDLTADDVAAMMLKQEDRCALSGIAFKYGEATKHPLAPSLDRIDSRGEYTIENCRVVLLAVNIGLNQWGDETFLRICKAVSRQAA